MPKYADPTVRVSELARGELIGESVRIASSADPSLLGLSGAIVDETLHTFTIESDGRRRVVGKAGQAFAFEERGAVVLIEGRVLAHRPEDRVKKASVAP